MSRITEVLVNAVQALSARLTALEGGEHPKPESLVRQFGATGYVSEVTRRAQAVPPVPFAVVHVPDANSLDLLLRTQNNGGTGGRASVALRDASDSKNAGRFIVDTTGSAADRYVGIQAGKDRDNTTLPIRLVVLNGSGALIDALSCAAGASAGRVGVNGVTSPSYSLDVAGDVNLTGVVRVNGTQVQGGRQAAIANATTTNADLQRAVNAILAALRTKGEIAP